MTRPSPVVRIVSLSRRSTVRLLAGAVFCALILVCTSTLAGAASSKASGSTISAHLTKKSFTKAQAGSVKLIYKFSATSKSFDYLLSFKKGSKWQTVKSVKKKGTFKGSKSMTAKKLFAGKAIKAGSYRLKLSADGGSKALSFKVVTAAAPVLTTGSKPANTALPIISGTTTQGQTLYASNGSWSKSPTSYSYEWRRCTSSGASCVNISGATGSSYTLAYADAGSTIRVVVTATNAFGSTGATSSQTAVVVGLAPANTALPTISGTTTQGQTLTASNGSWSNSPTSNSYQWRRCSSSTSCANISGATGSSYTLAYADAGSTIRVVVTATNAFGSTGATSSQTAVVVGLAPANTALPTISGTAIQGRTLTASNGSWSNSPPSFSYQWRRCSSSTSCANISGATSTSYTLVSADVDSTIRIVVTASNSYGSSSATSVQTAWVDGLPPVNLTLPTISGTLARGQTLTSSTGTWSNSPYDYYYEWYRCDSSGANCVYISSAYGNSYRLTSSDVGKTIHVVVEADNDFGYATATSSQTGVVGVPPVNTSLPTVSGSVLQGQTLTASNGSWSNAPTSWAYQWLRCDSYGANCTNITSATYNSYVLVSGDVGKTVRVVVTATSSSGSASATSERTGLVSATAGTSVPVNNTPPTISGDAVRDLTLTASDGTWSNSPTSYTYQWLRCNSAGASCVNITSATSSSYVLVSGDVGSTIRVVVTATNSYGSPSATSAQTAVVAAPSTTSVSAGYGHTCALISTGAVRCWGYNSDGQLGNGLTDDSSAPVSVSGISTATQISAGRYHTCALLSGGTVKCWGWNGYGQLGDGSTDDSSTPVSVSGISTAVQISGGGYHTCALLSDGTVKCWGVNWYGELGDGSTDDSSTPVAVSGISTATQISAGHYHTCALLSDGTVKCWGANMYGELGNGTEDDSTTPVQVKGVGGTGTLANVTQISAGYEYSCALLSGGTVDCWGFGGYGQLGNGAYVVSTTPVQVKGIGGTGTLSNVTQISAGDNHSCALLSGATANCWGDNEYGQLGDGSLNDRWTPVQVKGVGGTGTLSNVTQISAGGNHSCVLLSGATVNCWGDNVYGQLGDGSTDDSSTPVSVTGLP